MYTQELEADPISLENKNYYEDCGYLMAKAYRSIKRRARRLDEEGKEMTSEEIEETCERIAWVEYNDSNKPTLPKHFVVMRDFARFMTTINSQKDEIKKHLKTRTFFPNVKYPFSRYFLSEIAFYHAYNNGMEPTEEQFLEKVEEIKKVKKGMTGVPTLSHLIEIFMQHK